VEQPARRRSRPKKLLPGMVNAHILGAGWSSPVARQAHNLKVVGSNPTPATKKTLEICQKTPHLVNAEWGVFCVFSPIYPDIYPDIFFVTVRIF
jgi:hypothetical protein